MTLTEKQFKQKAWCLCKVDWEHKLAEKCEHNNGSWIVDFDGVFYGFDPNTQMQKDLWLDNKASFYQAQLDSLRWFCRTCGTVQMP